MEINLAKSAGFCFGVKRALDIALKTAKSGKKVCMLGDIVHNEDVVRQIQKAGIKKINKLSPGANPTLLIRAHGTGQDIMCQAKALGYKIIDATCPRVKEIHKIAKEMEQKGYKIIVVGDKKHDEVQGIVGQIKSRAIVVDSAKHLPPKLIKGIKKGAVVVQSTQNLAKVLEILEVLRLYIKNLRFFNTICKPTQLKQQDIRALPKENDVMVIIGSKTSANTKRLYEISKSINPRSYWVSSKNEIKSRWFKDAKKLGVTAGASTPDSTTQDVIAYIRKIV